MATLSTSSEGISSLFECLLFGVLLEVLWLSLRYFGLPIIIVGIGLLFVICFFLSLFLSV